jgi:hypothetical protein
MIFRPGRDSSPLESVGPRHPVATLKKNFFGCNTTVLTRVRALIADSNPFAEGKNLSNTGDSRLLPPRRNGDRNGGTVTTNHVFRPNQPRKASSCYRLGYGISIFHQVSGGRGGRGVSGAVAAKGLDAKAHSEFSG